jgi:hypothetical protein
MPFAIFSGVAGPSTRRSISTTRIFSLRLLPATVNHHMIASPVIPWGYCVMVLWFDGERGLAGAHSAGLSNTITLETKALIVRIYVRPQAAASLQKSSLM